jgi:hypothetical protein
MILNTVQYYSVFFLLNFNLRYRCRIYIYIYIYIHTRARLFFIYRHYFLWVLEKTRHIASLAYNKQSNQTGMHPVVRYSDHMCPRCIYYCVWIYIYSLDILAFIIYNFGYRDEPIARLVKSPVVGCSRSGVQLSTSACGSL